MVAIEGVAVAAVVVLGFLVASLRRQRLTVAPMLAQFTS